MEEEHEMSSLRARRKKASVGISCCFSGATQHRRRASLDSASSNSSSSPIAHPSPRLISPSAWIKSKTNDLPEIKGKCRNFISRMARHRRHASADFSYDPLSYALNFDEDAAASSVEEFQAMNNFTARLPVSPPRTRRTSTKTSTPFDHHLPKTVPIARSPPDTCCTASREDQLAVGSDELRRGLEALSLSLN